MQKGVQYMQKGVHKDIFELFRKILHIVFLFPTLKMSQCSIDTIYLETSHIVALLYGQLGDNCTKFPQISYFGGGLVH